MRRVTRGIVVVNEAVAVALDRPTRDPHARLVASGQPTWWIPNAAGLVRMAEAAGLEVTKLRSRPYFLRYGVGQARAPHPTITPVRLRPLRRLPYLVARNAFDRQGVPHTWLLASPMARDLA